MVMLLGSAATGHADPPPPPSYLAAVQRAYDIVKAAPASDSSRARADAAINVLVAGTGNTQPEIIADLAAKPPLYADATTRLVDLLSALGQPANTTDPGEARQRLHDVLSSDRYSALDRPPTWFDRLLQWIGDRIAALLRLIPGRRGGAPVGTDIWVYAIAVAVVGVAVFFAVNAVRGRFRQAVVLAPDAPRPAADYFAEADRLASRRDYAAAIRALCAAVAASLAGEGWWSGSPLTVREIFQRAPDFASLRRLLIPFEAAFYGGREVDQPTYERAAQAAAAFRESADKERAA